LVFPDPAEEQPPAGSSAKSSVSAGTILPARRNEPVTPEP
jgi:hypothetical protein